MTGREPDDQDRTGDPDRTPDDVQEKTDAAFAEIVAGWQAESEPPGWPDLADQPDRADEPDAEPEPARPSTPPAPADDDHFVPPEPPPVPMPSPRTLGGLLMLAAGVVLLAAPQLIGITERAGLPLGLLALASGIGWLLLGLRSGPPPDSGWDDGAQV